MTLVPTIILSAAAAFAGPPGQMRYDGDVVVRVQAQTVRDVQAALALTDDLWTHGAGIGSFDMRVNPAQRAGLDAAGLQYQVLIPDLQARIDVESARLQAQEGSIAGKDWFADFKNLAQVNAQMDAWVAAHPALVTPVTVGLSYEGRTIRGIRITRSTEPSTPAFLFQSCQHAREWATPMTTMYLASRLIEGVETDPRLSNLLDIAAVIIIPVVNVDGYEFSWTDQRLWRKNRQPNPNGSVGTDPNRNWGYEWGGEGASPDGGSETYRGEGPFSAPETAAMRDFYIAHPEIMGSIDIHSYSQLLMWPWAYTADLCPDDPLHTAVGLSMQYATAASAGRVYTAGPVYTTIYPASGGSADWSYGDQGVISFASEVRDLGAYGFIMPPEEIIPNALENYESSLAMIEGILGPAVVLPNSVMPQELTPDQPTEVSVIVTATAGPVQQVNLRLRVGTTGPFESFYMNGVGDIYSADIPAIACGQHVQYWFEALGPGGQSRLPGGAPVDVFEATALVHQTDFSDTMETDLGWTVGAAGDDATAGIWVRNDPVGTAAQPEDDHTPVGIRCWVTGNASPGQGVGTNDIDGGTTTLNSPLLNGAHLNGELVYWRWYSNNQGNAPNADSMLVEFSTNGTTWSLLEEVTENASAWVQRRIGLSTFLSEPGTFRIRFRARDLGTGSVVEAAVDDVAIESSHCPFAAADLNHDGLVDGADLGALLGAWGRPIASADLNSDGIVDGADLGILLGSWS